MNVVLDLDETLVRIVTTPVRGVKYDFIFRIGNDLYYGLKRPNLDQFLRFLFAKFVSVNVWTAAVEEYAHHVVRAIFTPEQRKRLGVVYHRGHLSFSVFGGFTKSLSTMFDRNSHLNHDNTIIIDDRHISMRNNYGNAIIIKKFTGNNADNELKKLIIILKGLLKFKNSIKLSSHKNSMFLSQLTY